MLEQFYELYPYSNTSYYYYAQNTNSFIRASLFLQTAQLFRIMKRIEGRQYRMNEFVFHNPVKLIFGKGQLEKLSKELPNYGKKVLVVYGGGSIKRNGLYDEVMTILNEIGYGSV